MTKPTPKGGFAFWRLPTVVDPAAAAIEAIVLRYEEAPPDPDEIAERWRQLVRVTIPADQIAIMVGLQHCNFFGNAAEAAACDYILGYSATGVLTCLMYKRADGAFEVEQVPEEFAGRVSLLPSIRFFLPRVSDAREVAARVQRIHESWLQGRNPDQEDGAFVLATLLEGAKEIPPRIVECATEERTHVHSE